VMGACGAALLAQREIESGKKSRFKGFAISDNNYRTISFQCSGCSNTCEVVKILSGEAIVACWGDRCQKYSSALSGAPLSVT